MLLFASYGLVKAFRVDILTHGVPKAEQLKENAPTAIAEGEAQ